MVNIDLMPNERSIHSISFPSETQALYWKIRRNSETPLTEIARTYEKSLPYVSKTLRVTNNKVKQIIQDTARTNMVEIDQLSSEEGFAVGFSPALGRRAYITFSPATGVHVWYEHQGDCLTCQGRPMCQTLLEAEAQERDISFPDDVALETDKAEFLYKTLIRKLKWD